MRLGQAAQKQQRPRCLNPKMYLKIRRADERLYIWYQSKEKIFIFQINNAIAILKRPRKLLATVEIETLFVLKITRLVFQFNTWQAIFNKCFGVNSCAKLEMKASLKKFY